MKTRNANNPSTKHKVMEEDSILLGGYFENLLGVINDLKNQQAG
jgi:hypothetical protein